MNLINLWSHIPVIQQWMSRLPYHWSLCLFLICHEWNWNMNRNAVPFHESKRCSVSRKCPIYHVYSIRQQAITWANGDPDLCRHVVSLGHNELMQVIWFSSHLKPCRMQATSTHLCVLFLALLDKEKACSRSKPLWPFDLVHNYLQTQLNYTHQPEAYWMTTYYTVHYIKIGNGSRVSIPWWRLRLQIQPRQNTHYDAQYM